MKIRGYSFKQDVQSRWISEAGEPGRELVARASLRSERHTQDLWSDAQASWAAKDPVSGKCVASALSAVFLLSALYPASVTTPLGFGGHI